MHQHIHWPLNKQELYPLLTRQAASLTEGCPPVSALANTAALLWEALPDINWAGFYLLRDDQLHLGPFQGKTACVVIPVGRGVCGTAARTLQIQVVPDVEEFPGHLPNSKKQRCCPLCADSALFFRMKRIVLSDDS